MYPDSLNADIAKLFHKDFSAYKISKILNVSRPTVLERGNKLGLDFSHRFKLKNPIRLKDIKDTIIQMNKEGLTTQEIARKTGYSQSRIWCLLNESGCDTKHKYYEVDLLFFDLINSYDKSYILGMWYADGCVKKDKISLQLTDKEIIEYVRDRLKYEGPIYIIQPKILHRLIQYDLSISRSYLCESLISKGCLRNKSLVLKFPTKDIVPDHLINGFILGWFDGDGNIYYNTKQNKWRIQLVGTKEFLEGIKNIISVSGYWTQRHPDRNNNNWNFTIGKQDQIVKFLEFIYKDNQFCLHRKKVLAGRCLTDLMTR